MIAFDLKLINTPGYLPAVVDNLFDWGYSVNSEDGKHLYGCAKLYVDVPSVPDDLLEPVVWCLEQFIHLLENGRKEELYAMGFVPLEAYSWQIPVVLFPFVSCLVLRSLLVAS